MAIWLLLMTCSVVVRLTADVPKYALICDHCCPDFTQPYGIVCCNHVHSSCLLLSTENVPSTAREWQPLDSIKNTCNGNEETVILDISVCTAQQH